MDFFDIGPAELILILIVAVIVMGPGKIVHISREMGRIMHSFRKATTDLTTQITRELDVEEDEHHHTDSKEKPRLEQSKNQPR